jgi:ComEC/Rec2-related protein
LVVPWRHFLGLLFVLFLGIGWANYSVTLPPLETPIHGTAECSLTNISPSFFHKKQTWRCELWIHSFVDESGKTVAHGTRAYFLSKKEWPFPVDEKVRFQATIQRTKGFSLQLLRMQNIEAIGKDHFSFLKLRCSIREYIAKAFSTLFQDQEVSSLLGTLCFSLPCSQEMRKCIHKVGLDHILGVSGFHFSQLTFWMALASGYLNRWAFSFMAWGALSLFFISVGPLPAVFRAWISSTLCIGQRVVGRSPNGFNSLGLGLLCLALYDPCSLGSLSLQLSFIATAALLAFFPLINRLLETILPAHPNAQLHSFSLLDQLLFCFLRFTRAALAVGLSITIVVLPYQLAYMSDFPLLGLFANLFLPCFFDIAFLLTSALLLLNLLLPFLTFPFAFLLEKAIQTLINVVREAPMPSWCMIQSIHLPEQLASFYIALMIFGGACFRIYSEYNKTDQPQEWLSSV